jgi:hypothetical protein
MFGMDLVTSAFEKDKNGKMKGLGGVKDMLGGKLNAAKSMADKIFHKNKDKTRVGASDTPLVNLESDPNSSIQIGEEFKRGLQRDGVNLPQEMRDQIPMMEEQMNKLERIGPQIQQSIVDSGVMDSMNKLFGKMEKSLSEMKPTLQNSHHQRRGNKGSIWNLGDPLTENINSGELNQRE